MSEKDEQDLSKFISRENLTEEEITRRQWQIIDAAIKIFSEKGFEGSRTSDIAKEAEVAEGTIFRYYKTKKDILVGLLMPMIIKFFRPLMLKSVEKLMSNEENKPIEEVMASIMTDRISLVRKNAPLLKTIALESFYHPELLEPIRKEVAPKIIPLLDDFIQSNIKEGKLRDIEPRLIARTLMSSLIGYMVLTTLLPDTFSSEGDELEMKKIADILLRGIGLSEGKPVSERRPGE